MSEKLTNRTWSNGDNSTGWPPWNLTGGWSNSRSRAFLPSGIPTGSTGPALDLTGPGVMTQSLGVVATGDVITLAAKMGVVGSWLPEYSPKLGLSLTTGTAPTLGVATATTDAGAAPATLASVYTVPPAHNGKTLHFSVSAIRNAPSRTYFADPSGAVTAPAPGGVILTDPGPQTLTEGTPYTLTLTGTPSGIAWTAPDLPPGLALGISTGIISGTPTEPGTYTATVTGTIGPDSADVPVTFTVAEPAPIVVTVNTGGSSHRLTGVYSEIQLTATPPGPMTWEVYIAGASIPLPAGLTLNPVTGLISGTPTENVDDRSVAVRATLDRYNSGIGSFALTVTDAADESPEPDPVTITDPGPQTLTEGTPYTLTLTADRAPVTFTATGLPLGLGITSGGIISGTPSAPGTGTATVAATHSDTGTGTMALLFTVTALDPTDPDPTDPDPTDPDPTDPEPDMFDVFDLFARSAAPRIAALLGRPGDPETIETATAQVPIVAEYVRGYTRGRGWSGDVPKQALRVVIISATARLTSNPEQVSHYVSGDYSERPAVLTGWTLPELAILRRHRRVTA